MNCQEFLTQVGEFVGQRKSQSASHATLLEHAAICAGCGERLKTERTLTAGLEMLATEDRKIEAPSFLRNDLISAFENRSETVPAKVVFFPTRSNWARWALAAAATITLGFLLFSARWAPKPVPSETATNIVPEVAVGPGEAGTNNGTKNPSSIESVEPATVDTSNVIARSREPRRSIRTIASARAENVGTQVASTEVRSEFVPLTYLNNATAMESGIVVRVEIAREQLATLGLPFDLERADEIIKADIVLGDDGVARAIRLVQ